jgi:NADP-dependent aldehyde dehydrogenase
VARTTGQLRLFAAVVRDCGYADPVLSPATGAAPDLRRINQARGPVAVFASSNFPFAFSVAGGDTASALAAGCPVLVKAHEGHPRTSERTAAIVAEALQRTGAPDGTFALIHGVGARHPADYPAARRVIGVLERVAGRIVVNGWPTGVAVVAAQHHGGPWPATTAAGYTSVGTAAIRRWLVPVAYQGFPAELLPDQLRLPA